MFATNNQGRRRGALILANHPHKTGSEWLSKKRNLARTTGLKMMRVEYLSLLPRFQGVTIVAFVRAAKVVVGGLKIVMRYGMFGGRC